MYDFNTSAMRNSKDSVLRQHSPDLFRIHEAFLSGRIVATESVQAAFVAAFSNNYKYFLGSLQRVLNDVIITAFDRLKIPKLSRL